jgi:hypothetical protein
MQKGSTPKFAIVVADRGFVYVGKIEMDVEHVRLSEAKNIRRWGTTKGLGELVLNGPTGNTTLDNCGSVMIPRRAVISIHATDPNLWIKS